MYTVSQCAMCYDPCDPNNRSEMRLQLARFKTIVMLQNGRFWARGGMEYNKTIFSMTDNKEMQSDPEEPVRRENEEHVKAVQTEEVPVSVRFKQLQVHGDA